MSDFSAEGGIQCLTRDGRAAPYSGLPIDPPFRSRFQARYVDGVEAAKILARQEMALLSAETGKEVSPKVQEVVGKMAEVMSSLQIAREMRKLRAQPRRSPDS